MKVLIVGAGVAGNALAFWLGRVGHHVTVIEHFPTLRASGLQIDLRGPGIEVLKRMGLESVFRSKMAPEQGIRIVDSKGRTWGSFPVNKSGKGLQSFTTDWEIMRGDLVRLLMEGCSESVAFKFGVTANAFEESSEGINVKLSDGSSSSYDLMVGADGVHSRVRKLMLAKQNEVEDPLHPIAGGSVVAYFTVPSALQPGEGFDATGYMSTGKRGIMLRRSSPDFIQVYIGGQPGPEIFSGLTRGDVEAERQAVAKFMHGAGWRTEELVGAMMTSEDFYCERIALVQMKRWCQGRVVLLGDAGYCPSVNTGMGTTCALVGAYILAGELTATEDRGMEMALQAYDDTFRPYMEEVQKGLVEDGGMTLPDGRTGVLVFNALAALAALFKINVGKWMMREDIKWKLPEYGSLALP
jgi:2-polyprenyl-6-methoxyphenol hydroxylase-like FAD-dependent oxidoreductase